MLPSAAPEIEYRLLKPRLELVALFRLVHVPVVFKIVKDNQIRTVRPVPQPAHTLARAERLDFDVPRRDHRSHVPNVPLASPGKIPLQRLVELQFVLDRTQQRRGLLQRVGYDQNVVLAPGQHGPQHEKQRNERALGLPARGRNRQPHAFGRIRHAGQFRIQPFVKPGIPPDEAIMRKIRPPGRR